MRWTDLLTAYFQSEKGKALKDAVNNDMKAGITISPEIGLLFDGYSEGLCGFEQTKVVWVNPSTNADPAIANGLAYSSRREDFFLQGARNILNSLKNTGYPYMPMSQYKSYFTSSFDNWIRQGVLMVNDVASCRSGMPGSHDHIGWQDFTRFMMRNIAGNKHAQDKPVLFILAGKSTWDIEPMVSWDGFHVVMTIDDLNQEVWNDKRSSYVCQYINSFMMQFYPDLTKTENVTFEKAMNFGVVNEIFDAFIAEHQLMMPIMPQSISEKMRNAMMLISSTFDANFMGPAELSVPVVSLGTAFDPLKRFLNIKED